MEQPHGRKPNGIASGRNAGPGRGVSAGDVSNIDWSRWPSGFWGRRTRKGPG